MSEETSRKGLGRGLSALLGDEGEDYASLDRVRAAKDVPIEFLEPSPLQPRHRFDEEEQASLVDSIREHGILQPILVRRKAGAESEAYEIVAGERRWRAAQQAQLSQVSVIIKDLTDSQSLEVALVENVQRLDLSPIEEAEGYKRLVDDFNHSQDDLGRLVGRSRSHIANTLRLLNLPDEVREMLADGRLTAGHGRALLAVEDPVSVAKQILESGLNVRSVEAIARRRKKSPLSRPEKDPDTAALEHDLSTAVGMPVEIHHRGEKGGWIKIRYSMLEQLDELCKRLIHHAESNGAE